jgi:hypothetical protein
MPWTRDPSGRLQSQQKGKFRRTTDFKGELWYRRAGQTGQLLRSLGFSLPHSGPIAKSQCQMPLRETPLSVRFVSKAPL